MICQKWDLNVGALYLRLDHGDVTRTIAMNDSTMVDIGPAGRVLGIELLAPGRPWPLEDVLARFPIPVADAEQLRQWYPFPMPELADAFQA